MAKSCQFIGYPYTLSTKSIPHCSWYDITDNIPQLSAPNSTYIKKKKKKKKNIKSFLPEDDDSQSESLLMLEQLHENTKELTDSQQVNQAINEQLDNDDSDQSDTVMTEQINEMSIINIDKKTKNYLAIKEKLIT